MFQEYLDNFISEIVGILANFSETNSSEAKSSEPNTTDLEVQLRALLSIDNVTEKPKNPMHAFNSCIVFLRSIENPFAEDFAMAEAKLIEAKTSFEELSAGIQSRENTIKSASDEIDTLQNKINEFSRNYKGDKKKKLEKKQRGLITQRKNVVLNLKRIKKHFSEIEENYLNAKAQYDRLKPEFDGFNENIDKMCNHISDHALELTLTAYNNTDNIKALKKLFLHVNKKLGIANAIAGDETLPLGVVASGHLLETSAGLEELGRLVNTPEERSRYDKLMNLQRSITELASTYIAVGEPVLNFIQNINFLYKEDGKSFFKVKDFDIIFDTTVKKTPELIGSAVSLSTKIRMLESKFGELNEMIQTRKEAEGQSTSSDILEFDILNAQNQIVERALINFDSLRGKTDILTISKIRKIAEDGHMVGPTGKQGIVKCSDGTYKMKWKGKTGNSRLVGTALTGDACRKVHFDKYVSNAHRKSALRTMYSR